MSVFKYEKDSDGIVTVVMDMDGPVNTMGPAYIGAMTDTVARLEKESGLKGVVFASAKKTFFAGGDLKTLLAVKPGEERAFFEELEGSKRLFRRLEQIRVPVVAAINGAALGGGFEICLACNRRILLNTSAAVVGLPEVTLGLLPGAGGLVRLVHLVGVEKALPHLLEGGRSKPQQALEAGLVDELVESAEALIPRAKAWIKANPEAWEQPWDRKGHKVPGGTAQNPHIIQALQTAAVSMAKKTRGLMPAPVQILSVVTDATVVDFDTALTIESRGLSKLVTTPQAKNIITSMFFQMNQVTSGTSRPKGIEKSTVKKLGMLGAGMMGQGIAYSSAIVGIEVVLYDMTIEAATKGKAYSETLLAKQVASGKTTEERKAGTLALIKPTATLSDLAGCDLIIEAVFENVDVKKKVTQDTEEFLVEGGVFASNTSTLPITLLAKASKHQENFIGIHFFSPVDRMQLVEIICGEKTSDTTLARAFDYARQIGKTPIVVRDSLNFFTSRVFGTFMDEGARLLQDGVDPVVIDNYGKQIGMPVGPLAVQDEVSQKLTKTASDTQKAMNVFGKNSDTTVGTEISELLIGKYNRGGRHYGGGYYEYPKDAPKHIWPKLRELFTKPDVAMSEDDIKDRLLFRQAIESVKCLEEGVLLTVAEGNIGSLLGIGAPTWTGGFLQYVNSYGVKPFVKRAKDLAKKYGPRFKPPALLVKMAESGKTFQ